MEETFRENIEKLRIDIVNRIEQLHKNIEEYKKVEEFENAMKCDIKRSKLLIVVRRLDEALENY